MRLLAPRSWLGFIVRLVLLIGFVAAENILFARFFESLEQREMHSTSYYISHASLVGGPLIAIFLGVSVYQVRLQQKLWRLSRKDGLTGLNNRRTFFELAQKARTSHPTGVLLMLDADRFKSINDTYGHQVGDICLKSISYTLQRSLRKEDIVGRLGGEEFAFYLGGVSVETARVIGERLTKPISFKSDRDASLSVTLSIGAAQWQHNISIDAAFARADVALYQAKKNGRARLEVWDPQMLVDQQNAVADKASSASM
ncbi:GGDEF domain-containing protein [Yoonia sp. GPGPB17]|uniref:GGDEF domain-containing protein n=1 Tax=Yoonia sp. GPGPB17 TaxID=3026147 RepID=UPI0030C644DE